MLSSTMFAVFLAGVGGGQFRYFFFFLFFFLIFIGVQLIYSVVLVSGVQHSESIMHIPISTPF